MENGLKLKAEDKDDLTIISAYLQDAVTVVADFSFRPDERIFVMMLNRYLWEEHKITEGGKETKCCHRIRTGCHFTNILSVSSNKLPQKNKKHILELLTIETGLKDNGNVEIDLIFAGDEVIRLEAELIDAQMQDIGKPYKAKCHPKHKILDTLSD